MSVHKQAHEVEGGQLLETALQIWPDMVGKVFELCKLVLYFSCAPNSRVIMTSERHLSYVCMGIQQIL